MFLFLCVPLFLLLLRVEGQQQWAITRNLSYIAAPLTSQDSWATPIIYTRERGINQTLTLHLWCEKCDCQAKLIDRPQTQQAISRRPVDIERTKWACTFRFNYTQSESVYSVLQIKTRPALNQTLDSIVQLNDDMLGDGDGADNADDELDNSDEQFDEINLSLADDASPVRDTNRRTSNSKKSSDNQNDFFVNPMINVTQRSNQTMQLQIIGRVGPAGFKPRTELIDNGLITAWSNRWKRYTINNQRAKIGSFQLASVDDLELRCAQTNEDDEEDEEHAMRTCSLCELTDDDEESIPMERGESRAPGQSARCAFSLGSFLGVIEGRWLVKSAMLMSGEMRIDSGSALVFDHSRASDSLLDSVDRPLQIDGELNIKQGSVVVRSQMVGSGNIILQPSAELVIDGLNAPADRTIDTFRTNLNSSGSLVFHRGLVNIRLDRLFVENGEVSVKKAAWVSLRAATDNHTRWSNEWRADTVTNDGRITLINGTLDLHSRLMRVSGVVDVRDGAVLKLSLSDVGSHIRELNMIGSFVHRSGRLNVNQATFGPHSVFEIQNRGAIDVRMDVGKFDPSFVSSSGNLVLAGHDIQFGCPRFEQTTLGTFTVRSSHVNETQTLTILSSDQQLVTVAFQCGITRKCKSVTMPAAQLVLQPRVQFKLGDYSITKARAMEIEGELILGIHGVIDLSEDLMLEGDESNITMGYEARIDTPGKCSCNRGTMHAYGLLSCRSSIELKGCNVVVVQQEVPHMPGKPVVPLCTASFCVQGDVQSDEATLWHIQLNGTALDTNYNTTQIHFEDAGSIAGRIIITGDFACLGNDTCIVPLITSNTSLSLIGPLQLDVSELRTDIDGKPELVIESQRISLRFNSVVVTELAPKSDSNSQSRLEVTSAATLTTWLMIVVLQWIINN